MDAVMLLEVLDDHGSVQSRLRVAGAGGQCRIGRSLSCDLCIDDHFAAAEHVQLTLQSDGRVLVQDLGTRNGTRHDGQPVGRPDGSLIQGGELLVGRTRVRVRTLNEPLPAERLFRRDLLRRHRTLIAMAGVALCFAFAAFTQWILTPERLAQRVLLAELLALAILSVWTGAWALVSRLTVGAWKVRIHVAIAACCLGLWVWGWWLHAIAAFALQWRWLGPLVAVLAAGIALAATYLHLRNATHFVRLASMTLAAVAALICGGIWWLVDLQIDPRTVNRVELGPRVQPPALRLAPSMDQGDYLTDAAALKREANRLRQASLLETPILDTDD